MRKARVFISCGQASEREKKIGFAIEAYFRERGFEAYFAEKVNSPEALTEHIFRFLKESEYFVFVDFKRDKIENKDEYKGSLFVNQELGIAIFLKIPGLGFVEKGVKREGIINYQIYNAFEFEDGTEILNILKEKTQWWLNDSVNELYLSYNKANDSNGVLLERATVDVRNNTSVFQAITDWRHIEVHNRNLSKHALACFGYVTKIKNLDSDQQWKIPQLELIWSGLGVDTVNIIAGTSRELDGFFLVRTSNTIHFNVRATTTNNPRFSLPALKPGKYLIEYSVISSNFPIVTAEFLLNFTDNFEELEFQKIED